MCSILPQEIFVIIMAIFHLFVTMTKVRLDQKKKRTIPIFFKGKLYLFNTTTASQSCCSVDKSSPTLFNPMNCSTPGFPVLYCLLEFTQIHATESVMLSNHLILCHPLLLWPSIFPSIKIFSSESTL